MNSSTSDQIQQDPELFTSSSILTNQIIVRFHNAEVAAASVDRIAQVAALSEVAGIQLTYEREMSGEAIVVSLPTPISDEEIHEIVSRILTLPEVEFAEPDTILQPLLTPNDSLYPQQWHYGTPSSGNYGINLPPAWDITQGTTGIIVAVLDTGFRPHIELAGRIVAGYDFVSDITVANDGNGRDGDAGDPGDWISTEDRTNPRFAGCSVRNSTWHGTHVAGTVAANSNNSMGVTGVNWQARILPVRVLGKCLGMTSDFADGIRWAGGLSVPGVPTNVNPARVINMSLGGAGACNTVTQNAINAVVAAGVIVIVAAGNSNIDAANVQPANCANVITVAATNRHGNRAYYSNFGNIIEISAPGGELFVNKSDDGVLSTLNTGTTIPGADSYAFYQGTSMAVPHIAGVISLILTREPALSPAQVQNILQRTVTSFPTGSSCTTSNCGSGIVNAANALKFGYFSGNEAWTTQSYYGERGTFFADVTGDGKADAIVVNNSGIVVRPSTGSLQNGGFSGNQVWTTQSYYGERGTFFADVTGDGKADAIVVNNSGVVVRPSTGSLQNGGFSGNQVWTTQSYYGERGTFFADVTGDGKADAIVVNNSGVVVRPSTGSLQNGGFSGNETWTNSAYYGTRGTFFADVTGDGKADAIVINDNGVTVRPSTGSLQNGGFSGNETWTNSAYYGTRGTFFADVTGDGKADAIVINDNGVTVRRAVILR